MTRPARLAVFPEAVDDSGPAAHIVTMQLRFPGRRTVTVHAFPSSDPQFGGDVARALDAARARTTDPEEVRLTVVGTLRRSYPNIRVVPQDELAGLLSAHDVWYAYRDAAVRPTTEDRERLYRVLGVARRTVDASEAALRHAEEAADHAGYRPARPDTASQADADRAEERV
jgi:hypothetical protein